MGWWIGRHEKSGSSDKGGAALGGGTRYCSASAAALYGACTDLNPYRWRHLSEAFAFGFNGFESRNMAVVLGGSSAGTGGTERWFPHKLCFLGLLGLTDLNDLRFPLPGSDDQLCGSQSRARVAIQRPWHRDSQFVLTGLEAPEVDRP